MLSSITTGLDVVTPGLSVTPGLDNSDSSDDLSPANEVIVSRASSFRLSSLEAYISIDLYDSFVNLTLFF